MVDSSWSHPPALKWCLWAWVHEPCKPITLIFVMVFGEWNLQSIKTLARPPVEVFSVIFFVWNVKGNMDSEKWPLNLVCVCVCALNSDLTFTHGSIHSDLKRLFAPNPWGWWFHFFFGSSSESLAHKRLPNLMSKASTILWCITNLKTAENSHLEQAKTSMWSKQCADVGFLRGVTNPRLNNKLFQVEPWGRYTGINMRKRMSSTGGQIFFWKTTARRVYISYRKESDYFSSMTAGISKSQDFMKKIKAEEWNPFQFWGFVMSVMPRLKYAIDGKSFQDSKKERAKIFSLHLLCINKTWCGHWKQGD